MSFKRLLACSLAAVMACSMFAGCGNSSSETEAASVATPSGEAIETDYGTVTLMEDYVNLTGEQTKSPEVTDEDVDYEIENMAADYTEYNAVERGAQDGDSIQLAMVVTVDGEEEDNFTESYYPLTLGDMEYGSEVDEQLTGLKAGDDFDIKVTYAEDDDYAPFPGSEVELEGTVEEVDEVVEPELTEEFIQDTLGYDSEDALRESIRAELEDSMDSDYISECKEDLMQQVIDGSEFGDYDEDLYNDMLDSTTESYESYAEMFGMDLDDFLSLYGMTEDDLADEALNSLHRYAVVMAIIEEQGLELTDEEYEAGLEAYAEDSGYETGEELESDYGEENIRLWLMDDEVLQFLYDHATIEMVEEAEEELVEDTEE